LCARDIRGQAATGYKYLHENTKGAVNCVKNPHQRNWGNVQILLHFEVKLGWRFEIKGEISHILLAFKANMLEWRQ